MQPPNFLIVMTDHQRADTVLPEHPCRSPHVERLAAEGVLFTHMFSPSPHCCPARATFFTGLYPSRHGVWNNICNAQALSRGLKPGVRLWSEDLGAVGYALHFVGKWHVSVETSPSDYGWTEHFVSAKRGEHHGVLWDRFHQLAQQPEPALRGEGEILRPGYGTYRLYSDLGEPHPDHDERVIAEARQVLAELIRNDRPWCLFVGLVGPHDPYCVPRRFLDLYRLDEVPLPTSYFDSLADKPRIYGRMRATRFGQLSPREVREAIRHYWAYCSYLDDRFGQLLDTLDRSPQRDHTLVLYTSDHGDYAGEHGLFAKGIPCFQGAYRVPAVVRWPRGIVKPGRRVSAFVSLADVAPTVLDLAGGRGGRPLTGSSLRPFLEGREPSDWRDEIHTQCNGVELYYTQRSVSTREWKYVFNGFDEDELYDLANDPHEMINLIRDPARASVKREMCRRLWRFAHAEEDTVINPYITVGLAPYGPAEAFR